MLRRHLDLLVHAWTCHKPNCVPNCPKMRELLRHIHECPIKSQDGCNKCRRVWLLLQFHAKFCKNKECPVPKCAQIRKALRDKHLDAHAPEHLECPLSLDLMRDPVVLILEGITYEREQIPAHINTPPPEGGQPVNSPITRAEAKPHLLMDDLLVANITVRQLLGEYKDARPRPGRLF